MASTHGGTTQGVSEKRRKKGSKRLKGWVECELSKREKNGFSSTSQILEPKMVWLIY